MQPLTQYWGQNLGFRSLVLQVVMKHSLKQSVGTSFFPHCFAGGARGTGYYGELRGICKYGFKNSIMFGRVKENWGI